MYMDLTDMISGGTEEQQVPEQKLTKEEYAAKKQQEREEVWAEVDIWDNLMRIKNHQVAAELLEIALGTTTESEGD